MAVIVLPSDPAPNGATPMLRDFGGTLTPFLGGPEQRINRLGTRLGIRVSMPPMRNGDNGRIFVSRLLQAKQDRLLMDWPQPGFTIGAPGSPLVSTAASGGTALAIKSLTPSYAIREGQFFSIVHGGRRYVHMFTASVVASGTGTVTASIFPPLRTSLSVNDVVEIAAPKIEGHVLPGEELSWQLALDHTTGISFSVMEAA